MLKNEVIKIFDDLEYIHKNVELASHRKLNIAIVGFNYKQSRRAMNEIASADKSTIVRKTDRYIEMSDGTRYHIFPTYNQVRGYCIDQMIIVDDFRWEVYKQQYELIDMVKYRMCHSCVPEEFQIQRYEYPVTVDIDGLVDAISCITKNTPCVNNNKENTQNKNTEVSFKSNQQLVDACSKIGIDVSNIKDGYELLDEISKKWNELKYPWYIRLWWFVRDLFNTKKGDIQE